MGSLYIRVRKNRLGGKGGFQYISCCSLSIYTQNSTRILMHFNTSHVVVYRAEESGNAWEIRNFNTSHVVVYR